MTTNITVNYTNTRITPPATQVVNITVSGEKGPQGPGGIQGLRGESIIPYSISGTLTTRTGKSRYRFPFNATINGISAIVDTPSNGLPILVDVNLDGASLFTNPSDRLTVPSGNNTVAEISPTRTSSVLTGQYLTVDIDQVGSVFAGSDLTVFIRYTPV